MPDGIRIRSPNRFRAQVRRNGVHHSKTFETLREARQWRRVTDAQASGDVAVDIPLNYNAIMAAAHAASRE